VGWPIVFTLTNVVAFIGWALLILLPRGPRLTRIILGVCVGLLCAAYTAMYVALFGGLVDPVRLPGTPAPNMLDYSVSGLRPFFMSDGGIVLGWTHYLAFDLAVGLWVAGDADARGLGRWTQLPMLLLILTAGPIGLLTWLVVRTLRSQVVKGQGE
jgi:hypothetical protein